MGNASSVETLPIVKRAQAKREKLEHDRAADLVPQTCPLEYESSRFFDSLSASAALERNGRLPLALRDDNFASRRVFSVAHHIFSYIPEEPRATLLFWSRKSNF